jgi:quercetin 2,3-dioxygenase
MLTLRRSNDRGHADHGWLKSFHSFSFADYHDPAHMGVGNLRVINEDRIAPGTGFGTHGHRDMEIVSYVLSGALAHKDSMGNGHAGAANAGVILPGDVQRMSAGTGVMHSEFNHAADQTTHFLQIWILPNQRGIRPGYEQKHFDEAAKRGRLALVASPDGRDDSVTIHADASIRAGLFDGSERAVLALDPQRLSYVHIARGSLRVNDRELQAGDAAKIEGEAELVLEGGQEAEVLVFDLAH